MWAYSAPISLAGRHIGRRVVRPTHKHGVPNPAARYLLLLGVGNVRSFLSSTPVSPGVESCVEPPLAS